MNPSDFAAFPTGDLCNADALVRAVASALGPMIPDKRSAGPALRVRISPGQNAAIHRAVHRATPGNLLAVDGGGSERFGPFGELPADGCHAQGIVGAILDCAIRDSADIAALGCQVFRRGFHPEAPAKLERGETELPVGVGGVLVNPGDIVVVDDDGVVVVPREIAAETLEKVALVAACEEAVRARLHPGEITLDVLEIDP